MKLLTVFVFAVQSSSLQFISTKAIPMNMLFVKDYLKFNNIPICVFLSCGSIADRIKNGIDFRYDDIRINWWGVSKESELRSLNYENMLVRLASPLSVVIDLQCEKSIKVMEEISSRKMWHYERFWLIFGNSWDHAYAVLRNQFINMDAEIHLALPANGTYVEQNKYLGS